MFQLELESARTNMKVQHFAQKQKDKHLEMKSASLCQKIKKYKSHDDYIIFLKIKSKKIFRDNKYLVS